MMTWWIIDFVDCEDLLNNKHTLVDNPFRGLQGFAEQQTHMCHPSLTQQGRDSNFGSGRVQRQ